MGTLAIAKANAAQSNSRIAGNSWHQCRSGIDQSTLKELINYHTNYVKETVSKNWNHIVGKTVDKVKVTKCDLDDINFALNHELAKKSRIKSGNILLQNIVEICITQNLKKYALPSEVLFPQSTEKYVNILLEIIGYRKFNKRFLSSTTGLISRKPKHLLIT